MFNVVKNGLSACKNIIIVMILLCAMNILPRQIKSMSQQRQEEAQREGVQVVNVRESARSNAPDVYTQTQAHARIKKMRELIQANYKDGVVPYFDIISRMVTKEAELKDTHYVFYHTTATMLTIMTDLYTQLHFNAHPEAKDIATDNTFRFLRFQGESKDVSAQQFLEKEMRAHGLVDDKTKELSAVLLSVNLSLFGNVGSQSESTWLRFLDNRRTPKWREEGLEKMMDHFGVTRNYIKDIIDLDKFFAVTPEAALVQIFIPKNIVDSIVYLAWIRGVPAAGPIMEWIKDYQISPAVEEKYRGGLKSIGTSREKLMEIFVKEKETNSIFEKFIQELQAGRFSTYAYLKAYCNTPSEVPYLNDTEGRIIFTKEGLHNPASGIQFYYYFSTPRESIEKYTAALNAIVAKLITEKGQKVPMAMPEKPAQAVAPKQAKPAQRLMPGKAK